MVSKRRTSVRKKSKRKRLSKRKSTPKVKRLVKRLSKRKSTPKVKRLVKRRTASFFVNPPVTEPPVEQKYRNALQKHNVTSAKEINDDIYMRFKFNLVDKNEYGQQVIRFLLKHVRKNCIQPMFIDISTPNIVINIPNNMNHCVDYEIFHITIVFSLNGSQAAHSNILLIDHIKRTFERFEPNGEHDEIDEKVNLALDTVIRNNLQLERYTFIKPEEFCPFLGPQQLAATLTLKNTCTAWSIWYVYQRLIYPNKTRNEIIGQITRENGSTIIQNFIYYLASQPELLFGGQFLN